MPITPALLDDNERRALNQLLLKQKLYPYRFRFNKQLLAANFPNADASGLVKYATLAWRPQYNAGIVAFATNFIINPQTVVDTFGIAISYSKVYTQADNADANTIDEEATQIYELRAQGGAINDFQVFYPLNWYVEAGTPLYVHLFAGVTTINAANAVNTMVGHVIFGTLPTGSK